MPTKQGSSGAKRRKKGVWIDLAAGRNRVVRDLRNGQGLNNIPKMGETGSAAYRRLMKKAK